MQTALDGREVGLPGGEAVVQLLPLLLAKGAVRAVAVAEWRTQTCLTDNAEMQPMDLYA